MPSVFYARLLRRYERHTRPPSQKTSINETKATDIMARKTIRASIADSIPRPGTGSDSRPDALVNQRAGTCPDTRRVRGERSRPCAIYLKFIADKSFSFRSCALFAFRSC